MIRRNIMDKLLAAFGDTPAVMLVGPRQCGKSTVAAMLRDEGHLDAYLTCDDLAVLEAAKRDPEGFIAGLEGRSAIDEIQRAPELLLAIKAAIDRDRRPGRFLLTGSADVLALPRVADALVGRLEVHQLHPFSQGEYEGRREGFCDRVFADRATRWDVEPIGLVALLQRVVAGGFPEVLARAQLARRIAWFNAYLTTIIQCDLRDLAAITGLADIPRVLRLVAARGAGMLNLTDLARDAGLPQTTCSRYLGLLENLFLVQRIPAWSAIIGKRHVKSPKVHVSDTGLAAFLLGLTEIAPDAPQVGPLVESFVVNELRRQLSWSGGRYALFHFRTSTQQEVDVVIERADGAIIGIEVKSSARVSDRDMAGLRVLQQEMPGRFRRGIVLYAGPTVVPVDADLTLVPIPALWQ